MVRFGASSVPNLTMLQTCLSNNVPNPSRLQSGLKHLIPQTKLCLNLPRQIWDMVWFWTYDAKPYYDPNLTISQIFQINLGQSLVWTIWYQTRSCPKFIQIDLGYDQVWSIKCSNLTMFQIQFGISQVGFRIWSHFGHEYHKSEILIWEVRNQNSDLGMSQIRFGTKLCLVYNRDIR